MKIYVPTKQECVLVNEDGQLINNFVEANRDEKEVEFVDSPDTADIIIIFEQFSFKLWNYQNLLKTCSLVRKFPQKIFTVNYDDHGRGHLPGCYTSLSGKNFDPAIHRATCYPRTYNELAADAYTNVPARVPRFLFSFCGTIKSHPVRGALVKGLSGFPNCQLDYVDQVFHQHTSDQKTKYIEQILDSWFVLCPRGWSPSTYRLFETMALGRCPVIISDDWVPIDGIAWDECSIRIRESRISDIPRVLLHRSGEAGALGENARRVWEKWFSLRNRNKHFLRLILELYLADRKIVAPQFSDWCQRWQSWGFYWVNEWTMPQRIRNRLSKVARQVAPPAP